MISWLFSIANCRTINSTILVIPAMLLIMQPNHALSNDEPTIRLIAGGSGRAIIELEGQRYILSSDNPSEAGISLTEANSEQVILNFQNQTIILRVDDVVAPIYGEEDTSLSIDVEHRPVTLWANSDGFFMAKGKINNKAIEFLVDTGANTVTFSQPQAEFLGLNYRRGKDGFASTASGITPLKSLKVRQISIGHITLYNVLVSVVLGNFPEIPLLGGTFLNNLNMVRTGNKMELSRR